jgi:hypothetical protein
VEDSPPVLLPQITAALGKRGKYMLDVSNQTKTSELFTARIIDSPNFFMSGDGTSSTEIPTQSMSLNLNADALAQIQIIFSPSSSGALVSGRLEVTSPSTGKESYILQVSNSVMYGIRTVF